MRHLVRLLVVGAVGLSACEQPILSLPSPSSARTAGAVWVDRSRSERPARAFVIERPAELLAGAEADGKLGDLKLDNGRVAFVIDAASSQLGFAGSGGNVIDAAPVGGEDALGQLFGYLGDRFPRQPLYERAEPGRREPDVATVRAIGRDSDNPDVAIETEYALRPGALALEITTTVTNRGTAPLAGYQVGDAIEWGRSERFAPGLGFQLRGELSVKAGFVEALGDAVTYAYVGEGEALAGRHGTAYTDTNLVRADLAPGKSLTVRRWLVVSDAAGSGLAETVASLRKESWHRLRGRVVSEGAAKPLAGARVVLEDPDGRAPVAITRSTVDGYQLWAPAGAYRVRAEGLGRRGVDVAVDLGGGNAEVDVLMSRPGAIEYRVLADGQPSPAKLTLLPLEPEPVRLGPPYANPGDHIALTANGEGRVLVPPGRYRVVASRGPALDLDAQEIEVPPGVARGPRLTFKLARAVDLSGWLCADLHQHARASMDAAVSMADRVTANLAEGLDVIVPTDHGTRADWQPVLEAAARAGAPPVELVLGEEATRDGIGHFNAYPLERHAEAPHGGGLDVRGPTDISGARGILEGLRAGAGERVIAVNHPRAGAIGYFNNVKLDPRAPSLPPGWEGGFDAIEVFSSKDPADVEAPLRDWFALLDRGLAYTAVGGSDSHQLAGEEVGYPRTCVPRAAGQPAAEALVDGIKHRRAAIVTNGPFVRVSVGGRGMGQLAPAPKGHAKLDIEVDAAPWVDVRRLEVVVNGERRGKPIEIAPSRAAVRYVGSVELKVASDSYVVVLVRGDQPLDPVVSQRPGMAPTLPLAIANPILLDKDLDGKYRGKAVP